MIEHASPDDALALVIPLTSSRERGEAARHLDHPSSATTSPTPSDEGARATEILERRVGQRWAELPHHLGREALRAEIVLGTGPTAVDPATTTTDEALTRAARIHIAADVTLDLLVEEADVLSEALGADITTLTLGRLHEVADAVIALAAAPPAVPAWGSRAEADAAAVVLELGEADIREAARTHAQLYGRFTEAIWDVPSPLLTAGCRRWRRISRARLARRLRAASRSGRVPGRLATVAAEVLAARAARARLGELGPLLSHHLGRLDRGPLSDIDAALASLAAVRRLQAALGELLDGARLERLLLADAFGSPDVVGPAVAIRRTLDAWARDVVTAGGAGAWDLDGRRLEHWVDDVAGVRPTLEQAMAALRSLGPCELTLRQVVEVLLLREQVEHLAQADERDERPASDARVLSMRASQRSWSAS